MFARLDRETTTPIPQAFMDYVRSTWVESSTWPPSLWSVYMESVRTNNDVEGWYLGLNRHASGKSQILLYLLINLLHKEAQLTSVQIRLVSEKKLKRIPKKEIQESAVQTFFTLG